MKINLTDLFDNLDPKEYKDIEIDNDKIDKKSADNIKKLVFKNINEQSEIGNSNYSKRNKKVRKSFRGAWVAVIIICLICTTAFAISKTDLFKEIFGQDAKIAEENIQDVVASTTHGNIIFTVESLLSDGNQNYFVISLEKKNGEEIGEILPIINIKTEKLDDKGFMIMGSESIAGPDDLKNKKYYLFTASTNANLIGKDVELILSGTRDKNSGKETIFKKELAVSFNIDNNNDNNIKTIAIENPQIINNKYYITEIKLSNLGINLKGKEIETDHAIPTPNIKLKYKNGDIKDTRYKTSSNPDVDFPNAGHSYSRNQDKKEFTNTIMFGEIVDINDIESIIVGGKEIKINK